jgi:hypothetical protein
MGGERRNMPEQERSIKDREQELFFDSEGIGDTKPLKPFPVYLQETPAVPMSPVVKVMLWVLGVLVALLFFASLWRAQRSHASPHLKSSATRTERSAFAPRWQESAGPCILESLNS